MFNIRVVNVQHQIDFSPKVPSNFIEKMLDLGIYQYLNHLHSISDCIIQGLEDPNQVVNTF